MTNVSRGRAPIGRGIDGVQLLVVNDGGALAGIDEEGEPRIIDTGFATSIDPIFLDANGDGLEDLLFLGNITVEGLTRAGPRLRLNVGGA